MRGGERPLRIAVDCMGGDHAPREIVAGALSAARAHDLHLVLVGVPEEIAPLLPPEAAQDPAIEIVPSSRAIPEGAPPLASLRAMPHASMAVTMRQVREGRADADHNFALVAGSRLSDAK